MAALDALNWRKSEIFNTVFSVGGRPAAPAGPVEPLINCATRLKSDSEPVARKRVKIQCGDWASQAAEDAKWLPECRKIVVQVQDSALDKGAYFAPWWLFEGSLGVLIRRNVQVSVAKI
jgi:hypothetical protein